MTPRICNQLPTFLTTPDLPPPFSKPLLPVLHCLFPTRVVLFYIECLPQPASIYPISNPMYLPLLLLPHSHTFPIYPSSYRPPLSLSPHPPPPPTPPPSFTLSYHPSLTLVPISSSQRIAQSLSAVEMGRDGSKKEV